MPSVQGEGTHIPGAETPVRNPGTATDGPVRGGSHSPGTVTPVRKGSHGDQSPGTATPVRKEPLNKDPGTGTPVRKGSHGNQSPGTSTPVHKEPLNKGPGTETPVRKGSHNQSLGTDSPVCKDSASPGAEMLDTYAHDHQSSGTVSPIPVAATATPVDIAGSQSPGTVCPIQKDSSIPGELADIPLQGSSGTVTPVCEDSTRPIDTDLKSPGVRQPSDTSLAATTPLGKGAFTATEEDLYSLEELQSIPEDIASSYSDDFESESLTSNTSSSS